MHYDMILFGENQCKKNGILRYIVLVLFWWAFAWNQVKYARIMITHVCFIALTLAGSLGRCLNNRPNYLVFKQLPWNPANVNA